MVEQVTEGENRASPFSVVGGPDFLVMEGAPLPDVVLQTENEAAFPWVEFPTAPVVVAISASWREGRREGEREVWRTSLEAELQEETPAGTAERMAHPSPESRSSEDSLPVQSGEGHCSLEEGQVKSLGES